MLAITEAKNKNSRTKIISLREGGKCNHTPDIMSAYLKLCTAYLVLVHVILQLSNCRKYLIF